MSPNSAALEGDAFEASVVTVSASADGAVWRVRELAHLKFTSLSRGWGVSSQ